MQKSLIIDVDGQILKMFPCFAAFAVYLEIMCVVTDQRETDTGVQSKTTGEREFHAA